VLRIFIALKNPSPWPVFEQATFGSSGQHTNHYTTKATVSDSEGINVLVRTLKKKLRNRSIKRRMKRKENDLSTVTIMSVWVLIY
jgi:hypothetical protein